MAYAEVLYCRHKDLSDNEYRFAILKDGFSGSTTEVDCGPEVFNLSYQEQPNIHSPFMASELTLQVLITESLESVLTDIINTSFGTYAATVTKNDELLWIGYIDNGLITWRESHYPIEVNVRAICGIGAWDKIQYSRESAITSGVNEGDRLIALHNSIHKIAKTFSHNIAWSEDGVSGDIVRGLQVNENAWQTGDDKDPQPVSQRVVAEQYAKRFLARWYQWKGWKLEQLESSAESNSFYKSIAGGSNSDIESVTTTTNVTSLSFGNDLSIELRPPISSSVVSYAHDTQNNIIRFPASYGVSGLTRQITYTPTDGDTIAFSGSVTAESLNGFSPGNSSFPDENPISMDLSLRTSGYKWDFQSKRWLSAADNAAPLRISIPNNSLTASWDFATTEILDTATDNYIRVTLEPVVARQSTNSGTALFVASTNNINYAKFYVLGDSDAGSESKVTQAITDNGATESFDHGSIYIGDGPTESSPYRLRRLATGEPTSQWISPDNNTIGALTLNAVDIDRLTVRTINRFAKVAQRVIRGRLLSNSYEPTSLLSYNSSLYAFIGGSLDRDGFWQGTWHELNYADESVTFADYNSSPISDAINTASGLTASDILNLSFARRQQVESESLTKLTSAVASGATVTSLTIAGISSGDAVAALKSGYKVTLLNIKTGLQQVFTVSSDYTTNATSLAVSSATAIADFPKGSALILNGESLTSYVVKTAQFYTAGVQAADVQSLTTLSSSLSGTVTALPIAALSYQVTDGQKLRVAQAADPNTFDEVEVATDTLVGATSIPIISTTLTNSYSSGDPVVFTVAQSSGLLYILAGEAAISATNASTSAATAGTARDAAVSAKTLAETARDNAEGFADSAEVFKNSASASASASATSAQAALTASTQSQSFASSASASATSASGFASSALTARNEAQTAAGVAQTAQSQVSAVVNGLDTQIVLKGITNADGTTSIAQVALNTAPGSSNVTIAANDIQVAGQTTFLSSISSAIASGDITSPSAKITRSDNAPSSPALNDIWVDTNDGDKPYSYNGSTWVAMYTSINGGNIVTGSITANQIATNAITTQKIAADAITTEKIAALAVTAAEIAADAITADKISANAIQSTKINAGAVTAEKIAAGAITADKIAAGTITADKIAAGTVIAADVTAGSITSTELATNAVTAVKIAANAITADKISANAVTSDKINVTTLSAVTANTGNLTVSGWLRSANYVSGSAGFALNQDGSAEFQQVTVKGVIIAGANSEIDWQYVDNVSIVTAQIGDAQITTAKIADATITNAKIANLDATKITTGTLSADRIASGSITADKITATNLQAITTSTGALTVDGTLTIGAGGKLSGAQYELSDTGVTLGNSTKILIGQTYIDSSALSTRQINLSGVQIPAWPSTTPTLTSVGNIRANTSTDIGGSAIQVSGAVLRGRNGIDTFDPASNNYAAIRGAYQSSDGTAGISGTLGGFTDLIVKNGLIVGYI